MVEAILEGELDKVKELMGLSAGYAEHARLPLGALSEENEAKLREGAGRVGDGKGEIKMTELIPIPNFQCPKCGKMSIVSEPAFPVPLPPIGPGVDSNPRRYRCLACGYIFC